MWWMCNWQKNNDSEQQYWRSSLLLLCCVMSSIRMTNFTQDTTGPKALTRFLFFLQTATYVTSCLLIYKCTSYIQFFVQLLFGTPGTHVTAEPFWTYQWWHLRNLSRKIKVQHYGYSHCLAFCSEINCSFVRLIFVMRRSRITCSGVTWCPFVTSEAFNCERLYSG